VVSLLVVAGEASGDRAAAAVVARLRHASRGVEVFGMGGAALAASGMELVSDLRDTTALGVGEVAAHLYAIARAHRCLLAAASKRRPHAALLVNYTEYNARLAPRLAARGIPVLWYGAPQIWAWRPGRATSLRRSIDRMAVVLPFEEALWRKYGVDAHYVGHPALEGRPRTRAEARALLGLTPLAPCVAIMPGSRPHEVRRLLEPMLAGYDMVRRDRASLDARVLLASSLDTRTRDEAVRLAESMHVAVHEVDAREGASGVLPAFDATLCASGTASLEAALARAVPVVAYKVGLATELVARALVSAPYVALPNVLLGRPVFSELLQRDAQPRRFAQEIARALDGRRRLLEACAEVEDVLGPKNTPSRLVAEMLSPWLGARTARDSERPLASPAPIG
jgi:lipid-A-disaccharide synthase